MGVFVHNCYADSTVVAYDLATGHSIEPGLVKPELQNKIASRYSLAPETNPLTWAASSDGHRRFQTIRGQPDQH